MYHNFKIPLNLDVKRIIEISESTRGSQAGQDLFVVAMLGGAKAKTFLEVGAGQPDRMSNTYLLEKEFEFSGVSIDIDDCHFESWPRKKQFKRFYSDIKDPDWPDAESLDQLPQHIQKECRDVHFYEQHVGKLPEYVSAGRNDWQNLRPLTQFYLADAVTFDYAQLECYYDYLQIDIDPLQNFLALERIMATSKEFAVITFEHDLWDHSDSSKIIKQLSQDLLMSLGYQLIADNVTIEPGKGYGFPNEPMYFEDWYANPKYIDKSIIDAYRCIGTGFPKYYYQILFTQD